MPNLYASLLGLAETMKFLAEDYNPRAANEEDERKDLLFRATDLVSRLQRAIEACEESLGFGGILGQCQLRGCRDNVYSGTALAAALMGTEVAIACTELQWSWPEFSQEQIILETRAHRLWRRAPRSTSHYLP